MGLSKEIMVRLLLLVNGIEVVQLSSDNSFYWLATGPDPKGWIADNPLCGGLQQSPIDIRDEHVVTNPRLGEIFFTGYHDVRAEPLTLSNSGKNARITGFDPLVSIVGGGLLASKYELAEIHFHWGSTSTTGAEHTVNGRVFPLEMHLVHFSKNYASFADSLDRPQGLAVLGVLFEISSEPNQSYDPIIRLLSNITHAGDSMTLPPISLRSLLPENVARFWRYRGSLTTPPCYESVMWTVFKEQIKLSESQASVSVCAALGCIQAWKRREMDNPSLFPNEKAVAVEAVEAQTVSQRYPRSAICPIFLSSDELFYTYFEAFRSLRTTENGVEDFISDNFRPPQPINTRIIEECEPFALPETQVTLADRTREGAATTKVEETTQARETTQAPETTQAVETRQAAETTQAVQTTQAVETTQAVQTTQAVKNTEAVQITQAVQTTQAVETKQAIETTQAVETTKAVDKPPAPKTPHIPKTPPAEEKIQEHRVVKIAQLRKPARKFYPVPVYSGNQQAAGKSAVPVHQPSKSRFRKPSNPVRKIYQLNRGRAYNPFRHNYRNNKPVQRVRNGRFYKPKQ